MQKEKNFLTECLEYIEGVGVELHHGQDGHVYGRYAVNGRMELNRLDTEQFFSWTQDECYRRFAKVPTRNVAKSIAAIFRGRAKRLSREYVSIRVLEQDGAILIDLGDPEFRCVRITRVGWEVVPHPGGVLFHRGANMLPLPIPTTGGEIGDLRRSVNLDMYDFKLLIGFLMISLNPRSEFPILHLLSPEGSGKSTIARIAGLLLDPNHAQLLELPSGRKQLMVNATHRWLLAYDNASELAQKRSDELARVSTGGGAAYRTLYTDADESIFSVRRPQIITGITEIVERPDLMSRTILIEPPILRKADPDHMRKFELARPKILGALYDGVANAMRNMDDVTIKTGTRFPEFERWITAAETNKQFGWRRGSIMKAYQNNQDKLRVTLFSAHPIVPVLVELLKESGGEWAGTPTRLLSELREQAGELAKYPEFPKSARQLGHALSALRANLRKLDIHFARSNDGTNRRYDFYMEARKE